MNSAKDLLAVKSLTMNFQTRTGTVKVLENVELTLAAGEILGLVGESGSGKTVLSYFIMGLLDASAQVQQGQLFWQGQDLLLLKNSLARQQRRDMAMIFQNPRAALNPIRKIGEQVMDVLQAHQFGALKQIRQRAEELLALVQLPPQRFQAYPFQLSGGMCQRVLMAIALAKSPKLLVADEPTTGLDVVTQEAVMQLIRESARKQGMATLLITHDLGLAARYCQRIAVMHAGHLVEVAAVETLFQAPKHPYTAKLIKATPGLITHISQLESIGGQLPDLRQNLPACRYSLRCERYQEDCQRNLTLQAVGPDHYTSCWHPL